MNFGPCQACKTYKYLEEEATCPTCLDEGKEWVVMYVSPHHPDGGEVYQEDLTEDEAHVIASGAPRLRARHESALSTE